MRDFLREPPLEGVGWRLRGKVPAIGVGLPSAQAIAPDRRGAMVPPFFSLSGFLLEPRRRASGDLTRFQCEGN